MSQMAATGVMLAQDSTETSSLFVWIVVLLAIVGLLLGAVYWARKRLSPNEEFRGEGFTLSDLRQMHETGQLTDEEFERAKAKMVEALHAAQARKDTAKAE